VNSRKYKHSFNLQGDQDDESNYYGLRLFCVRFNIDATGLIAGSSRNQHNKANLKVFDVNMDAVTKTIHAHDNDINTICYV
jgi:hypothetical protein